MGLVQETSETFELWDSLALPRLWAMREMAYPRIQKILSRDCARIGAMRLPKRWWTQKVAMCTCCVILMTYWKTSRYVGPPTERPHSPVAGTSSVSMFVGELQVDLSFSGSTFALRVMDFFAKYSLLATARSKNPQELWGVFSSSRTGVLSPPKCFRLDVGGKWENDIRTDSRSVRRIKFLFQGVGARPWVLGQKKIFLEESITV